MKLLTLLFCLAFFSLNAFSSRYVTVATIGTRAHVDASKGAQGMVDQMIDFWKNELNQVLPDKPDLILLSEGSDMPRDLEKGAGKEYYNARKNQLQDFFASVAAKNNCYIAFGSIHDAGDGKRWNSIIILDRKGKIAGVYHKNFPTIGEIEGGIKPGTEAPIIQCDFGRVACAICFDLNFNELRVQYEKQKPDLILISSMYHGGVVQGYYAYANRAHMVTSMGFREIPSEIRNPYGAVLESSTNYFDFTVKKINLDCELVHLDENWGKLKQIKAKYGNTVIVDDPGQLGSVLITSENDNVTVDQIIKEFKIEKLDEYLDRSRQVRLNSLKNKN